MKKALSIFIILLLPIVIFGQETNISFGTEFGIPANEFKEVAYDVIGIGLGGSILYNPGDFPIYFGVEGGYMLYGKTTNTTNIWVDDREVDGVYLPGAFYNADFVRNNNIVHGHLVVRLKPMRDFFIMPYIDGLLGFKYLYTRTKLKVDDINPKKALETNTEFKDLAWSYGGTAGVNIKLSEDLFLDINVMYQKGGKAKYLTEEDVEFDPNGDIINNTNTSRTDMFVPRIGITFRM